MSLPYVTHYKNGDQFIIKRINKEEITPSAGDRNEKDELFVNVAEVTEEVTVEPLVLTDFKYVSTEASDVERGALLNLLNKYRNAFAKNMSELGCTQMIEMHIDELEHSLPVVSKPYKTLKAEREAIADC